MPRIHIFGASGSGCTTLGGACCAALGGEHHDTDDYYWEPTDPPFTTARPLPDRLQRLREALTASSSWVLSGSLFGWGDPLISLFDLVVWLEVPTPIRLARLRERERERYGAAIEPGGRLHAHHVEFMSWTAGYDDGPPPNRCRAHHADWFASLPGPTLRLDGTQSPTQLVAEIDGRAG